MDKDTIIKLLNKEYPTHQEALTIIADYCIEMNKAPNQINTFINTVAQLHLDYYFSYALNYYKKKFGVVTIMDKEGKILLTY